MFNRIDDKKDKKCCGCHKHLYDWNVCTTFKYRVDRDQLSQCRIPPCAMKQTLALQSSIAAITANKNKLNCSIYSHLGQRMQSGIWQDNLFGPSETQDQWTHSEYFFFYTKKEMGWDKTGTQIKSFTPADLHLVPIPSIPPEDLRQVYIML